ncbi:MAG TPA: VOC family protein [Vicinamibacterales bacterium]|nr:VOC family protein [Vicinamibacterales bacterium]
MKTFIAFALAPAILFAQTSPAPPPAAVITTAGAFFALSVPDLAASAAWYEQKLGLTRVNQGGRMDRVAGYVALEGGGLIVELIKHDDSVRPPASSPELIQGFSKAGALVRDFDRTVAALRARGVVMVMGPFPARENMRANVAFKDNAGNLIQLFGDYARK